MNSFEPLQTRLGHHFTQPALLQRALTHRSFGADHNERLEYLGDAVLDLVVAHWLYEALARQPEGDLSRVRANLVKQDTLHRLAVELGLPDMLRLSSGERRAGGQQRPSILADALEAVIGAVYLDGGYATANALVRSLFSGLEITPQMQAAAKDAKTALQEWLQARHLPVPDYAVTRIAGAAHQQTFEVSCHVQALALTAHGRGGSRRMAEQAAAAAMLEKLQASPPPKSPKPGKPSACGFLSSSKRPPGGPENTHD